MALDDLCQRCAYRKSSFLMRQSSYDFDCADRRILNKRQTGQWAMRNCSKFVPEGVK